MRISFKTNKLEKSLTDAGKLNADFGEMAKKVNQRMKELYAAANLGVIAKLPAAYCHELKVNRAGTLAVKISGNWRIVFEPDHDPIPLNENGGLNWNLVTAIKILEIVDYH
jgi:Plasmid maintenance system killer protein